MEVRPIDANRMEKEIVSLDKDWYVAWSAKVMLTILRRQPTLTQSNEPLTLDELRETEGQPVWLGTGEVSIKEQIIGCWEIVCRITRYDDDTVFWLTRRVRGFWASDYGKTWLAYRRPPEGEKKNMKCKHPKSVCGNMTVLNGVAYCDSVPCSLREELPPMTNADRIRTMSDVELLEFLKRSIGNAYMCKAMRTEPMFLTLAWLQQPAEEV